MRPVSRSLCRSSSTRRESSLAASVSAAQTLSSSPPSACPSADTVSRSRAAMGRVYAACSHAEASGSPRARLAVTPSKKPAASGSQLKCRSSAGSGVSVNRTALSSARNAPESARSVLCRSKVRKWKLLCSHSTAPRISALPVSRSMAGHPLRKNVHRRSSG